MFIVPVMAVPFWATVQVIFPGPLVSADLPAQVPDMSVAGPAGLPFDHLVELPDRPVEILAPHARRFWVVFQCKSRRVSALWHVQR
jgi:hypothetical protein